MFVLCRGLVLSPRPEQASKGSSPPAVSRRSRSRRARSPLGHRLVPRLAWSRRMPSPSRSARSSRRGAKHRRAPLMRLQRTGRYRPPTGFIAPDSGSNERASSADRESAQRHPVRAARRRAHGRCLDAARGPGRAAARGIPERHRASTGTQFGTDRGVVCLSRRTLDPGLIDGRGTDQRPAEEGDDAGRSRERHPGDS